ncbi:sulfite exporter TauE/SafE family protein [Dinoroseobacter sp. S76]|uniref:sulfite exporter TauE/SafE family protein n=1 Tax=Dinoroseobacter sp. S76 TaxID=3415124 RepID=UPI003C7B39BA
MLTVGVGGIGLMALGMALAGSVAGVLAGLFGIGGGAVLVPILVEFLGFLGVPESVRTHMAVGTSLAIIVPTSIRSYRAHAARGAPDRDLLRAWALWVPVGVLVAGLFVAGVSGAALRMIFAGVAILIALKMLLNRESWTIAADLPPQPWRSGAGFGIGFVSTFMGIGGGNLNNVFMTSFGRTIHQAVATSAGLGVLIAIPGVLTYVLIGLGHPDLPPLSLGYVNLIALLAIMPVTMLCAPLGVRLAHGLSKRQMEILFGVFLLAVAARFISSAF